MRLDFILKKKKKSSSIPCSSSELGCAGNALLLSQQVTLSTHLSSHSRGMEGWKLSTAVHAPCPETKEQTSQLSLHP